MQVEPVMVIELSTQAKQAVELQEVQAVLQAVQVLAPLSK